MIDRANDSSTATAHRLAQPDDRPAWSDRRLSAKQVRALLENLDPCADDNKITHLSAEVLTPLTAAPIGYVASGARTCAVPRVATKILRGGQGKQVRDPVNRETDTLTYFSELFTLGHRSAAGRQACQQLGEMHRRLEISNEDQLYTLAVLMFGPQQLAAAYRTQIHSDTEIGAAFSFWRGVGEHMGLAEIPTQPSTYQMWMKTYETRHFQPSQDGHLAAEAHVAGLRRCFPSIALHLGRAAVIEALDEHTRSCLLYQPVPKLLSQALQIAWRIHHCGTRVRPLKCSQTWARGFCHDR
jgi:hypothetical protein